jgi:hypothetical protein
MPRTLIVVLLVTLSALAHGDVATPITKPRQPSPASLVQARFYRAALVADVERGAFDPFAYQTSPPISVYFPAAGTVVLDRGQELDTYRVRAIRRGEQYELVLYHADGGERLDQKYFWRWLPDGRVRTNLLWDPDRTSNEDVLSRLDRSEQQLDDEAERRLALARLPAIAGLFVAGTDRILLTPDASAWVDGQPLVVRAYRARLDCGGREILALALRRGGKTVRTLGLIDARTLVEEDPSGPVCIQVPFYRNPAGRVYVRR